MDKNDDDRYTELIQAARDAAFEAAEAMDRRDLEGWNRLQDRAADLRKEADSLKKKHTPTQSKKTGQ